MQSTLDGRYIRTQGIFDQLDYREITRAFLHDKLLLGAIIIHDPSEAITGHRRKIRSASNVKSRNDDRNQEK